MQLHNAHLFFADFILRLFVVQARHRTYKSLCDNHAIMSCSLDFLCIDILCSSFGLITSVLSFPLV